MSSREYPKTLCPSEVARALSDSELRALGFADWRESMPPIRECLWEMRREARVEVLQKGEILDPELQLQDVRGPIRFRKLPS